MKWITVTEAGKSKSGKTKEFDVHSVDGCNWLGRIGWYGPWRKYCFAPVTGTIWEQDCLRDVAEFIESVTREHREAKRNGSQEKAGIETKEVSEGAHKG